MDNDPFQLKQAVPPGSHHNHEYEHHQEVRSHDSHEVKEACGIPEQEQEVADNRSGCP